MHKRGWGGHPPPFAPESFRAGGVLGVSAPLCDIGGAPTPFGPPPARILQNIESCRLFVLCGRELNPSKQQISACLTAPVRADFPAGQAMRSPHHADCHAKKV